MERYKDHPVELNASRQQMKQKCRDFAPKPLKDAIASGNRDGTSGDQSGFSFE